MRVTADLHSDVGQKRADNQDRVLALPARGLFAVADGMGGHLGGETAATLATATLAAALDRDDVDAADDSVLALALERANAVVFEAAAADPRLHRMGTTTTALWLRGARAVIAHVGDSRAYLLRDGALQLLTDDHAVVFQQLKNGSITAEQARQSPFRNVVLRAVGVEPQVQVDLLNVPLLPGDRLLLCSDGLSGVVDDEALLQVLQSAEPRVARQLVARANAAGGPDNISAIVIAVDDPAPAPQRDAAVAEAPGLDERSRWRTWARRLGWRGGRKVPG